MDGAGGGAGSEGAAVVCRYWVSAGRCFFGSDCKFRHPTAAAARTVDGSGGGEDGAAASASSTSSSDASAPSFNSSRQRLQLPWSLLPRPSISLHS